MKQQKGVAALLTVIIISSVVLVMGLSTSYLGLGELNLGFTEQKGSEALAAAEGCMEDALMLLRLDNSYSGGSLSLENGSCIISVSSTGSDRTLVSSATVFGFTRTIQTQVTISSNTILLNSWQEIVH